MNYKIGKNAERRDYRVQQAFRNKQRILWRHECKLKKMIPCEVANLLRGADLGGKPVEVIEDTVRLFCGLQQIKFHKKLVQRALLIWLAYEIQDRVKNCLTIERNSAKVLPL